MTDYIVKDIDLADFGRKELDIAETEMPWIDGTSLWVWRKQATERRTHCRLASHDDPDGGLDWDIGGAGYDERWASCNIFSTYGQAEAAIAAANILVFAIKG